MPGAGTSPGRFVLAVVLLGVAVGVLVGVVGLPGMDDGDDATCRAPGPDVPEAIGKSVPANGSAVNVTVSRIGPEAIRFTYHGMESASNDFGPAVPAWIKQIGVRVHAARGFAVYRSENGTDLVWNNSVAEPQLTFVTSPPATRGAIDRAGAAITPEWAFIPLLPHSGPVNVSLEPGQPGVVGDQVLLLGDHRTVRREAGCQDIQVHVPAAVEPAVAPDRVADTLATAATALEVGWRYETVRVFAVGGPIEGGRTITHEVWVNTNATVNRSASVGEQYPPSPPTTNRWLHQYLHTRQRWLTNGSIEPGARWLTEAIPTYYQIAETARQGELDRCNATAYWHGMNATLHRGPGTVRLSKPVTYRQVDGDYTQGAYVLAALDARLAHRHFGSGSLQVVWRRLNERPNVTAERVEAALAATGGAGADRWLERYVNGTEIPPPPPMGLQCNG